MFEQIPVASQSEEETGAEQKEALKRRYQETLRRMYIIGSPELTTLHAEESPEFQELQSLIEAAESGSEFRRPGSEFRKRSVEILKGVYHELEEQESQFTKEEQESIREAAWQSLE